MNCVNGLIVKALGGFYYVKTSERVIECRARGVFRKNEITPYVGDNAVVELTDDQKGYIIDIVDRKNSLVRPPVANLDRIIMVVATKEPIPNLQILDKLIAISEYKRIEPVIVVTKNDLEKANEFIDIYKKAGFQTVSVSAVTGEGVEEIKEILSSGISAFCGNTGVGKSSLLNAIDKNLSQATAEISQKLGRGKHTTRHIELFMLDNGGYIADTPGFSSIDADKFETILKGDLENCFREFEPYIPYCQYTGCSHTKEKGCKVLEAVANGEIGKTRHESYMKMYEDAKGIKEWEKKNKNV
ncbi:MAG: ribosome small subunit-dependent GTPase A [Oscillospiraceae bacterium]